MSEVHQESFDYIIVGAGSAGCLLANRLSADPSVRVLLLEAGGADDWIWFRIPVGYRWAIGNPRADWCYATESEPGLNARSITIPRGRVLGGSSSINAMVYIRGQRADYDDWRDLGLPGWGWDDVLPVFRSHEDYYLGANSSHGAGGECRVEVQRVSWDILDVVRRAAIEEGIPAIEDFNSGDNEGAGPLHVNQRNGRRWSASSGFLHPVSGRANLKVETGALVERVLFEGRRAVGVKVRRNGATGEVRASAEVILAAGAINTPQLLLLSGVGPASQLGAHGIPVVSDMHGVGANLHDHLQLRLVYRIEGATTLNQRYNSLIRRAMMGLEYALFRRGPLSMAPSSLGMFTRSHPGVARADLGYMAIPFSTVRVGGDFHDFPGLTMAVYQLRPSSRGTLQLKSADPQAHPALQFNYLATDEDRRAAMNAIRQTRRILAGPAMAPHRPAELVPGPQVRDDDEAGLMHAAGDIGATIFHPVGSARMGLASDPNAVVDARLKVIGLEGLRVVDASIMPSITSGNTAAPVMMIAEKGAAMIRADARR